jgi:hypothetical protein
MKLKFYEYCGRELEIHPLKSRQIEGFNQITSIIYNLNIFKNF